MGSRNVLEQKFARISQQFSFKDAHFELACDKRSGAIIQFVKYHYFTDEPLDKSIGVEVDEEVENSIVDMLKDNISIILISDLTDEIIAVNVSYVCTKEKRHFEEWKNKKMQIIDTFLAQKDDELNPFSIFGVNEIVYLSMLGVDRRFRNQGIATEITKVAITFYAELGWDPVVLKVEGSSNFTKAIYEKCGFETLHELPYEDFKMNDEVVFKNTGTHKSTKVYVKKI